MAARSANDRIIVSVVLPYWHRPKALAAFYDQVERWHSDGRYEFIVVDDGCMSDPAWPGPPNVTVVRLPAKPEPLNPCVPLNRGVDASRGQIVVLTGCEVIHRRPDDLARLVDMVDSPTTYAVASCWDTERGWIQHPEHQNTRLHWFTALRRSWFDEVGGFDEEYRNGYAYEDADFVRRLERAGTTFRLTTEIVVEHRTEMQESKALARGRLPSNRALFESKAHGSSISPC